MSTESPNEAVNLCQAARESLQQGNVDDAIAQLQQAIAQDPRNDEAYALLGVAYAQKGMTDEGIEALSTAVSLNPNNASSRMNLAAALQRAGRLHEAAAELNEALRIDPTYQKAQESLAAIQAQLQAQAAQTPEAQPSVFASWEQATGAGVACPSCQTENKPDAQFCFNCGQSLTGAATQTVGAMEPVPPMPGMAVGPVPFEAREKHGGFLPALWETWKEACFSPNTFFEKVGRSEDLNAPLLFAVICGSVGIIVSQAFSIALQTVMAGLLPAQQRGGAVFGMGFDVVVSVVLMVLAPLWVLLGLIINAGIAHVGLMIFGGAKKGFNMTLRTMSYASAAQAFGVIPLCGGYIGGIWALVLGIIGLAKAHETDTWRAVLAVLLPLVVCCGLMLVLGIGFVALIFGAAVGAGGGVRPGGAGPL
ncbi:MAG: tetratricopeptide repeat protein [Abditibacteriales bacterium]|nr:tetratricopeptide repeat protein [Abditibacteriales bacterium]MDW8364464.1 tetratricopeptide repeat protein [Abditibacteriales bacterium]